MEQPLDPTILTIFGAGGDLTWRKLVPALYRLFCSGWLPEKTRTGKVLEKDSR